MFKDQAEIETTKNISPLQLETSPPTKPNEMEHDAITEYMKGPPRVKTNSINTDTDAPSRVNIKTLTTANNNFSKAHANKDHESPTRVMFVPMHVQIDPLPNPSYMTCKANPNILVCPTRLKISRVANMLQL